MLPRYDINKDFNEWFDQIKEFELKQAIKKINAGHDVDTVLEEYSQTINKSLLHAVFINIKNAANRPYDAAACRKKYFDNTPKNYHQVADHILE